MKRNIVSLAAASLLALPTTSYAASMVSITDIVGAEYNTAGVYVKGTINFTGTSDDAAGFDNVLFQIFDDGTAKFAQTYSVLIGETKSFQFETNWPGLVGTSAPGIGLYVYDDGNTAFSIDPLFLPHYADPSQCQINCGPIAGVPEPSTWALMLLGFGLIGSGLRNRRYRAGRMQARITTG